MKKFNSGDYVIYNEELLCIVGDQWIKESDSKYIYLVIPVNDMENYYYALGENLKPFYNKIKFHKDD